MGRSSQWQVVGLALSFCAASACGGHASSSQSKATGYAIVAANGGSLTAVAGDALGLKVVQTMSDGSTADLPASLTVAWTVPPVIAASSPYAGATADPLPLPGSVPTGTFLSNAGRPDVTAALVGVLFVLDPGPVGSGSLPVSATVSNGGDTVATVSTAVVVTTGPVGDATNGQALYTANCAVCHGATGDGSPQDSTDLFYTIKGQKYTYPAPGLNAAPDSGNLGDDPTWTGPLMAMSARADVDNNAVSLRLPMPNWLLTPDATTGQPMTTQDFADIYAYLTTETQ